MHSLGNESVLAGQSSEPANVEIPKPASSGDENRCSVCLKVFQKKYSLKRHLMMHSPEKKYKCSLCDRRFSHPYNRKRHIIRHQQKDDRHKQRRQSQAHPTQKQPPPEPEEPSKQQQQPGQQRPIMSLLALEAVRKSSRRCVSQPSKTTWACPHCRLVFHSADLLELHEPLHQPLHIVAESAETAAAQSEQCCPDCGADFSTRAELIKHVGVHGKRGPPKREKPSSEATDSENQVVAGGTTVVPSSVAAPPQRTHKCSLCYKGFATEDRLAKHYQVHGNDETKPLKCSMCDKRFLNNSALTGHLKTHKGERYFECPICKEKFHVITALKEHVYTHRQDGVYTCPTCDKKFGEYNQVRKHIRAFHTNQRFLCQQCPKVFPRQDKLKLHMLCHSEHREFLCALCGRQFKRKDKLKDHMRRLHGPDKGDGAARGAGEQSSSQRAGGKGASSARPPSAKRFVPKVPPTDYQRFIYKCHTCMLGFKRRGMLVNHMAKRHPSVQLELVPELNLPILRATRDYYCQYCEKVYRSSSKRKAHILKNHPGAALPLSNRCKGGLPQGGEPNPTFSHMVGSVTTQPHSCCLCHKQYASKAKLLQHQRKKHTEMVALFTSTTGTNTAKSGGQSSSGSSNRGREADLLTRAMSELTQGLTDLRQGAGATAFLTTQTLQEEPGNDAENLSVAQQEQVITETLETSVETTEVTASTLDQAQINLLLAQYQQQAVLGGNGEGGTDVPVVSMADVVVAPNAQSCWTIVSVTAPGDEAFEQDFAPA